MFRGYPERVQGIRSDGYRWFCPKTLFGCGYWAIGLSNKLPLLSALQEVPFYVNSDELKAPVTRRSKGQRVFCAQVLGSSLDEKSLLKLRTCLFPCAVVCVTGCNPEESSMWALATSLIDKLKLFSLTASLC